jgi:hypothetical protein
MRGPGQSPSSSAWLNVSIGIGLLELQFSSVESMALSATALVCGQMRGYVTRNRDA